jgi:phosphonate transport system permease protein
LNSGSSVDVRVFDRADSPLTALSSNVIEARRRFKEAFTHRRAQLRRQWIMGIVLMIVLVIISSILGEVDLAHLWKRLPRFTSYFGRMVPDLSWASLWPDLARWYWNGWVWLAALWQTILIAIYATLIGVVFGFIASFLGARNLSPNKSSIFVTRRCMEVARTVPELVFAVLFVYSFGLGPLAGVLAIGLHSMGALGKLFADVAENVDLEQVKGIRSTGANWSQTMMYGVTPQVLPDYLSYGLLRFEINVRAASILGFVGAGGIGQELYTAVKSFNHTDISAIAIMLIIAVIFIDSFCSWLRGRVIGHESLKVM